MYNQLNSLQVVSAEEKKLINVKFMVILQIFNDSSLFCNSALYMHV